MSEFVTQEKTFVEGDSAFTVATVGFVMVPEWCSHGSAEGHTPCTQLGGFLIGVNCDDDEPGGRTAFVVCADHLREDLAKLTQYKMEREQQRHHLLANAWGIRQRFHADELVRNEPRDRTFDPPGPAAEQDDVDLPDPTDLDITCAFLGHDEPGKPWTVSCDCGYISWHKSGDAAKRKARKHAKETPGHDPNPFYGND